MTHGPLSWRELVERDKQKSEDARGQIKRAAMPVQADPVAELRAEITRLTEALRAAEERERDAVMSAYCTGATDVHNSWVEGTNGGEADFGEAASDYYSSIKGN